MNKKSECNYQKRMKIWKKELLNEKAQGEEAIRSNAALMSLMQKSDMLLKEQIEYVNEEIEFADSVITK